MCLSEETLNVVGPVVVGLSGVYGKASKISHTCYVSNLLLSPSLKQISHDRSIFDAAQSVHHLARGYYCMNIDSLVQFMCYACLSSA